MPALTFLPLDLKGTKASNRIQNETRVLVKVPDRPHRVLIPRMGAFFEDSNLKLVDQGRLLVKGVDYTTTYLYRELTHLAGKPIYAFLVITNPAVSNNLTLDYQAVGGPFGLDVSELQALLDTIEHGDQNRVDFEDIINKPKAYNPLDHMDEYWQLYGAENTVTVINRIGDVIAAGNEAVEASLDAYAGEYLDQAIAALQERKDLFTDHLNNRNNPHQDTKETVGLGLLNNWPMATVAEHNDASLTNRYTHPQGGMRAITDGPLKSLQAHITDYNNPHRTTYAHIGAHSVSELTNMLNAKLSRTSPAYNTNHLFGMDSLEFKQYAMSGLSATAFTSGIVPSGRMGSGTQSTTTLLMGDKRYRRIQDLVAEAQALYPNVKIISVRSATANTAASAIQHANITFSNLTQYPVGTLLVYHALNTFDSVSGQYEMKMLVRNASGWTSYIP